LYRCLHAPRDVNPELVSLARPSNRVCGVATSSCERERGPRCFAEALPSEDSGEHPGEARQRTTWRREGSSAIHGVTQLGSLCPCTGIPFERGSNNED
jgi:hypothetical protein